MMTLGARSIGTELCRVGCTSCTLCWTAEPWGHICKLATRTATSLATHMDHADLHRQILPCEPGSSQARGAEVLCKSVIVSTRKASADNHFQYLILSPSWKDTDILFCSLCWVPKRNACMKGLPQSWWQLRILQCDTKLRRGYAITLANWCRMQISVIEVPMIRIKKGLARL